MTAIYYAEFLRGFIEFCEAFNLTDPRAVTEATIETHVAQFTARGCSRRRQTGPCTRSGRSSSTSSASAWWTATWP